VGLNNVSVCARVRESGGHQARRRQEGGKRVRREGGGIYTES